MISFSSVDHMFVGEKATHASYFKGIFENAQNEEDSTDAKQVDLKRKFYRAIEIFNSSY